MNKTINQNHARNNLLDIMKGILIILVVLGHTNSSLIKWIYSFHMAAFFAISGFLWNDKYSENKESMLRFVRSRVRRIYVPFVLINVVFICLHNWLIKIHIYTTDPAFAEITTSWPVNQVTKVYSVKEIAVACLKSFLFKSGSAPLVSVCWFLSTLFLLSIAHLLLRAGIKRLSVEWKRYVSWALLVLCLALAYLKTLGILRIPGGGISRLFPAYGAFLFGMLFKEYLPRIMSIKKQTRICVMLILIVAGLLLAVFTDDIVEMSKGYIVNPVYFVVCTIQGILIVYLIASAVVKWRIAGAVKYFGVKSMSIMLFHVSAFKIVNYILILLYGRSIVYLASRPVIYDLPEVWSILYVVVGVGVPVCFDLLLDSLKRKNIIH